MPWFRLRRARRYTVSSKNSYVVCVNLLDNTLIECTLTADSTGQECLENIAQRIELNQVCMLGCSGMHSPFLCFVACSHLLDMRVNFVWRDLYRRQPCIYARKNVYLSFTLIRTFVVFRDKATCLTFHVFC